MRFFCLLVCFFAGLGLPLSATPEVSDSAGVSSPFSAKLTSGFCKAVPNFFDKDLQPIRCSHIALYSSDSNGPGSPIQDGMNLYAAYMGPNGVDPEGSAIVTTAVLTTIAIGALIGSGTEVVAQTIEGRDEYDWGAIAGWGAIGGLTGGAGNALKAVNVAARAGNALARGTQVGLAGVVGGLTTVGAVDLGMQHADHGFTRQTAANTFRFGAGFAIGGGYAVGKMASAKIIGSAQSTGTRGHSLISSISAHLRAINPRVARVSMDLGYKRLIPNHGGFTKYGPRPDIGVLYKSGRVKAIEVPSKTDVNARLIGRNRAYMNRNSIDGSVRVNEWARRINKLWPKPPRPRGRGPRRSGSR